MKFKIIGGNETKNSENHIQEIKNNFSLLSVHDIEASYIKINKNKAYGLYKISHYDKTKKDVGVLVTDNFYFIFDYNYCVKDGFFDAAKLKGWFESSHGERVNKVFSHHDHPFKPPEGDWQINFLGPYGSVLYANFYVIDNPLSSIKLFGQYSRINNTVSQQIWKSKNDQLPQNIKEHSLYMVDEESYSTIQSKKKYESTNKLVGGSSRHPEYIMNISLFPDTKEQNIQFIESLLKYTTDLGYIYAHTEKATLKGLLDDMHQLQMTQVLLINSCRSNDGEEVTTKWPDTYNFGPSVAELLGLTIQEEPLKPFQQAQAVANDWSNQGLSLND